MDITDIFKMLPSILISIITMGVFLYFLIKYQITKSLKDTIDIYQKEIAAYKEQSDRHEQQIATLQANYDEIKRKKNYLKQIVIEAMQTKKDIKDILDDALKGNGK